MKIDTDESRRDLEAGCQSSALALSPSRMSIEVARLGPEAGGIKRVDIRDKGNYGLSVGGVSHRLTGRRISQPETTQGKGGRREGSCGGWNCCLLPFSPRAATHSAFPLCRPGSSAGVLVSSEDEGARRAGCGGALGATGTAPGTSWVTA